MQYMEDCVYWYTYEETGNWFVDTLGKRFHMKLLGYENWFMSISISQLKDHSISVDQYIYATSILAKYLYTTTIKDNTNLHKTTLPHDMIFNQYDASTNEEQVEVLSIEYNIKYKDCVRSLIYLFSTRLDLFFAVHNIEEFSSNPCRIHFEGLVHF